MPAKLEAPVRVAGRDETFFASLTEGLWPALTRINEQILEKHRKVQRPGLEMRLAYKSHSTAARILTVTYTTTFGPPTVGIKPWPAAERETRNLFGRRS